MLAEFGRLVFRVENGQLGEHAHMGPLKAERCLQKAHELLEVAPVLVVVNKIFQLVRVDHDVEAAHLGQAELVVVHAGEAHLLPRPRGVGLPGGVNSAL